MIDLVPCPFCHCETPHVNTSEIRFFVECPECYARGPRGPLDSVLDKDRAIEFVSKSWNDVTYSARYYSNEE